MEHQHKYKIQYNIQNAGENQKIKRSLGIANGTQNTASHVVYQQSGNTPEINAQVGCAIRDDICGSIHDSKHGPNPYYT